jgi:segregation and condensation protein B
MTDLNQIIEALVFTAGRVISADEIRETFATATDQEDAGPSDDEIAGSIEEINADYESTGRPFRIHRWAGGFRMATTAEVASYVQALLAEPPRRLTRSLMETLSIVAYRQPITKPEVDNIRGVDSNYGLRKLMELGFVAMVGRSDTVGRPLLFGTTQRFLEEFGLLSLDDLPKLREAEELFQNEELLSMRAELEDDGEQEEDGEEANKGEQVEAATTGQAETEHDEEEEESSKAKGEPEAVEQTEEVGDSEEDRPG